VLAEAATEARIKGVSRVAVCASSVPNTSLDDLKGQCQAHNNNNNNTSQVTPAYSCGGAKGGEPDSAAGVAVVTFVYPGAIVLSFDVEDAGKYKYT
jgi:hypothetical protein